MGLTVASDLGGLLVFFIPTYVVEGKTYADITALITHPSLFMGLSNFVSMLIALAIGRRPVSLSNNILLVASCILCATNQSYEWQLGARCVLGLAAGQSEALCPLIVQVCYSNTPSPPVTLT
jgi:predicted MFS family arabinose efflux permease